MGTLSLKFNILMILASVVLLVGVGTLYLIENKDVLSVGDGEVVSFGVLADVRDLGIQMMQSVIGEPEEEMIGPDWEKKDNGDGSTTMTIYSYTKNVKEDGTWKDVKDAKSLLGTNIKVKYLEDDPDFPLEIIDYNYTSITIKLMTDDKNYDKDIPLRKWKLKADLEPDNMTGNYKDDYLKVKEDKYKLKINKEEETITIPLDFGDILEWGFNSTVITLDEDDMIYDTYFHANQLNSDKGSETTMRAKLQPFESTSVMMVAFNLSSIPDDQVITKANLSLYLTIETYDPGDIGINITAQRYLNKTPVESSTGLEFGAKWSTNNWQPPGADELNQTAETALWLPYDAPADERYIWEIPEIATQGYDDDKSVRVFMQTTLDSPEAGNSDFFYFATKEHTTSSKRPRFIITYVSGADITPPEITIVDPKNQSYTTTSIDFTATNSDPGDCNYTLNAGITNYTMTQSPAGNFTDTNSTMSQGPHTANFYCNDDANNTNFTESVTFAIDTVPPASVTNLINTTLGVTNATLTWTNPVDTDYNATIIYRDSVFITNTTSTTYFDGALSALTEYTYTFHTIDHLGNLNDTDVNLTITTIDGPDTSAPIITLSNINTTITITNNYTVSATITPGDEDVDTCILEWNGTNESMSGAGLSWSKEKTNLVDATYPFSVFCNNTDNYGSSTSAYIIIDYIDLEPNVTLNSPADNATDADGNVTFLYTPYDDKGFTNCQLYGNWNGAWESIETDNSIDVGDTNQFVRTGLPGGTWLWNVKCTDTGSQEAFAIQNRTINIGDDPPTVTLNAPANGATDLDGDFEAKFTPSDDRGFLSCSVYGSWNGGWSAKQTETNITNNAENTISIFGIASGTYVWNVECIDTGSQAAFDPSNRTIIVDLPAERKVNFRNRQTGEDMFSIDINNGDIQAKGDSIVEGDGTFGGSVTASNIVGTDMFVVGEEANEFVVGKHYPRLEEPNVTSPRIVISGAYESTSETTYTLIIDASNGNTPGYATFNYSNDGTTNWTQTNLMTQPYFIKLDSGVQVKWDFNDTQTFETGDVYSFSALPNTTRAIHVDTLNHDIGFIESFGDWFFGGEDVEFNTTILIGEYNVTSLGWFFGMFDIAIDEGSQELLSMNGTTLSLNQTNLNLNGTVSEIINETVNNHYHDQSLNTTDDVRHNNLSLNDSVIFGSSRITENGGDLYIW